MYISCRCCIQIRIFRRLGMAECGSVIMAYIFTVSKCLKTGHYSAKWGLGPRRLKMDHASDPRSGWKIGLLSQFAEIFPAFLRSRTIADINFTTECHIFFSTDGLKCTTHPTIIHNPGESPCLRWTACRAEVKKRQ